jgi:predicted enzyme related to lactoylglutathione lyase
MGTRFVYAQLQTSDPGRATVFYRELCGWTVVDDPPGDGPPYTEAFVDGESVAGIMPVPASGLSTRWLLYLSVDDIDVATEKAQHLGATLTMPPTDIVAKGCRISILTDPTGGQFALRGPLLSKRNS